VKSASGLPEILLALDDDGDEAQAIHILTKYHFANSITSLRSAREALNYFTEAGAGIRDPASLPELIILSIGETGVARMGLAIEARKNSLATVPLIVLAETLQIEQEFRGLNLPRTYMISKPIGFFKLLEAMQKLGMYWTILKAPPG